MTSTPRIRPRDAATLIVLRTGTSGPEVLMGRRHMGHKFMPGKYVFPGGRVDLADSRIKPADEFSPGIANQLLKQMRGRPSPLRAKALALAAIRETFEETGLAVGVVADGKPASSRSPSWSTYFSSGFVPALSELHFVARAITPPGRVRRFDTRFFAIDKGESDELPFVGAPSDELEELDWVTFAIDRDLDLPSVTHMVIDILEKRTELPQGLATPSSIPFFFQRGKIWITEELQD